MANGILNVGREIVEWEQDDYPHSDLLKELGVQEFGGEGQGYGVIENDVARIDVDCDGLDQDEVAAFMPVPGGIRLADAEALLRTVATDATVIGAGFTGLVPDSKNLEPATRLSAALGL